ncbi:YcaO-like family protein [Halobaculum sp. MBLA0143]|uniref:YcaO-like family protein n=1 Tax=Halobaculum sp. MBLA0143 TaxID=3079933 RepID=UPI00352407E9
MEVALVGPATVTEPVAAALSETDATTVTAEPTALERFSAAVVAGPVGADRFDAATPATLVTVEFGGLGGRRLDLDAAVSVFSETSACPDCLRARVAAGTDGAERDGDPTPPHSTARLAGAVAGHRLARLLGGESLGGTVVEVSGREREFLPVPGCGCRSSPDGLSRGHREVSLSDAVARMERVVDDRLGPVREVGEQSSFPVPYYVAATADTTGFADARCGEFGAGVAGDWNAAYAKAVGEALERYAAGVYRESSFRHAPTAGVIDAVPVSAFVTPDGAAPDSDDRVAWTDGVDLRDESYAALPASFVNFPAPGRQFAPQITTGLGLGNSTDEALAAGLAEVIERDATMLAWYSTFEPVELVVDTPAFQTLRKRARAESLTVTPLLCTQDVDVPVVAVAVHRDGEWPRFALGSAAGFDASAAATAACAEALQNWTELESMGPERATDQEAAVGRYAEFPGSVREFVDAPATVDAGDVTESVPADERVDELVARLADADLGAYAAGLTTVDLAELGFEAVRVVAPGAQPLFTAEPFFGERAEIVPAELGFEPRLEREFHPFP